jgi:acetyl esterase/lipase
MKAHFLSRWITSGLPTSVLPTTGEQGAGGDILLLHMRLSSLGLLVAILGLFRSDCQEVSDIEIRRDLQFGIHDGVALLGDYYAPKQPGKFPVVVAVHGGGWQLSSKAEYQYWGPYLARHGVALFSIDYRLSKPGQKNYPKPVHDVRAAIQFVKSKADELKIDPNRVGLIGNSAGAHLAALVALAGDTNPFVGQYETDSFAHVSTKVKAVVGVYGVYDLVQQWNHDLATRPADQVVEKLLGTTPIDDRKIYFEASPINYVIRANNKVAFFLSWGTADDMAPPSQSDDFLLALKQAEFFVRTAPVQGAPHFWMSTPMDEPGSPTAVVAPQVLRFLQQRL